METNDMPEKPSDDDFEIARKYVAPGLHTFSLRECKRIRAVLRYLLALHDAKPSPVAVPEPVVEWRKYIADTNTTWGLWLPGDKTPRATVGIEADRDRLLWVIRIGGVREAVSALVFDSTNHEPLEPVDAKARAEELCGVSTTKGA